MNSQNISNNQNFNANELPDLSSIYPEIFYRLQPYIIMMCDQLDAYYGDTMPNQDLIDQITENIYRDILEMYPDIAEYAREKEREMQQQAQPTVAEVITRRPRVYSRGFRRRGLLRDLLDILFLSELFRRRRRSY